MSIDCIRRSGSQWTLCKCDDCRREMRRKVKLRRNGLPIITDQRDAARARIAGWAESGYSVGVIAQMTGIRKATLIPHILGTRTEISHATAKRIMAATELPETGGFIPSVGTSRRLRALTVMGWSMSDLAARCELAESTLHALRDSKHRFTRPKYAKVVADLFDQLSMTRGHCRYAAARAIRKGWRPPMAWEDIDNPNENPSENVEAVDLDEVAVARLTAGDRVEATRDERLEALRELTEAGMSDSQCATRLRVTERTIQRWRLAHDTQAAGRDRATQGEGRVSRHLLTITAPCDWLRLNGGHGNRYAKADLIRRWRAAAAWEAKRQHQRVVTTPVRIVATVHLATKPSRWDATNWLPTAKACIDGLVDAEVLVDDSNKHVIGPDMRAGEPWADAALVLTIEEIGDAA